MAGINVGGLATGLDTATLIGQLMAVERQPVVRLEARRAQVEARVRALDDFASKLAAIRTAARAFATASGPVPSTVSSSVPNVVSASVGAGARPATLTFRVAALAAAHQVSSAPLANAAAPVGAGTLTASSGAAGLGITGLRAGGDVAAGAHTFTVTQASAAAAVTGTALGGPVVIDASNDRLDVVVNGAARSVTIAAGTYASAEALATAVATALEPGATATTTGGALVVRTAREGSAATLEVTGGTALTALGLTAASAAGTDAVVKVGEDSVAIGTVEAGATATVATAAGTLSLTLGGHLAAGSAEFVVARTTETSTVADLAAALSVTSGPVEAAVISTGSDARLVVSARGTGTGNALTLDVSGMAGLPPAFATLRAAADAELVIGTGAAALRVSRSSNTVSDVLPGVTLNLAQAAPDTDVTVTVGRDADALVAQVKKLVESVNAAVGTLKGYSTYDAKTGRTGPLAGLSALRTVLNGLFRDASEAVSLGVSAQRDGSLALDEAALRKAVANDPDAVAAALANGAPKLMDTRLTSALGADGTVPSAKDGAQSLLRDLQGRIDAWDPRLAKVEESYRRRFAALEAAIGGLRNQSSWLASQISSLGR